MTQKSFPRRGDIKMPFAEHTLFISGMRFGERNLHARKGKLPQDKMSSEHILTATGREYGNGTYTCFSMSFLYQLF